MRLPVLLTAVLLALLPAAGRAEEPLRLFAAGSLREALTDVAAAYTRSTGRTVSLSFGFSGRMRERIEQGDAADLLASADMGHPERLRRAGLASHVILFARNALCVAASPGTGLTDQTVVEQLTDPNLAVAVFPAVQDPAGDYTLELFRRLDAVHPGAEASLRRRMVIVGEGLLNRPLKPGEDAAAAWLLDAPARLHVTYCTTARNRLVAQAPGLEIASLPASLQVGPVYGLALLTSAQAGAADLALFLLEEDGQRILARFGFTPVGVP